MEELLKETEHLLEPWYESLREPEAAQEAVLKNLLNVYSHTIYGKRHGAKEIKTIEDYRERFPIVTYADLKPYISLIRQGQYDVLLTEAPIEWALTSGTRGPPKLIPLTPADMQQRFIIGGRAIVNYLRRTRNFRMFEGYDLNLHFPGFMGTIRTENKDLPCGYITGIYAKRKGAEFEVKMVPTPEEVDALGAGTGRRDWERRLRFTYERSKNVNITMSFGTLSGEE